MPQFPSLTFYKIIAISYLAFYKKRTFLYLTFYKKALSLLQDN